MNVRGVARRVLARRKLQDLFRLLYRFSLLGMNYGGAGSEASAGDELALHMIAKNGDHPVVFDVGANVGSYISSTLAILKSPQVYAFEPSPTAFGQLRTQFSTMRNVELVMAGLGSRVETLQLYAPTPGSVLASTYANPLVSATQSEAIELVTLDGFCDQRNIAHIDLLKLDVEGGELDALRGASRMLRDDAIGMIQFEFGQSSLGSRTFFIDLFRLLEGKFEIFRLLPNGLAPISNYHETLEVFMSTNYLAVRRSA